MTKVLLHFVLLHRGSLGGGGGGQVLPPLEIANCFQFSTHYKVPENAPEAVTGSLKSKISWGTQTPLVYMCLCTYTQGFAPPLFHFTPPLDQFLNEPLLQDCSLCIILCIPLFHGLSLAVCVWLHLYILQHNSRVSKRKKHLKKQPKIIN